MFLSRLKNEFELTEKGDWVGILLWLAVGLG